MTSGLLTPADPNFKQAVLQALSDHDLINRAHRFADTDRGPKSVHHTLGRGVNQGSPGNHNHDGSTSLVTVGGMLAADPVVAAGGTTSAAVELTLGSQSIKVIKGRTYMAIYTAFDANSTVVNDRFTFRVTAGGTTMGNTFTFTYPSITVAATPLPPIIGTWKATATGTVTFDARVVRAAGTGTLTVNSGFLYVFTAKMA